MSPGPGLLARLASAVAASQLRLLRSAVEAAQERAASEAPSLLALGFSPPFFTLTELSVSLRLDVRTRAEAGARASLRVPGLGRLELTPVNARHAGRFQQRAGSASALCARLVAAPGPALLGAALRGEGT